jgi:1,4-alpha-glucan branching enzyme
MGIPDHWIKLVKERRDEDWNLREIFHILSDRRYNEKTISYSESHDQALVGDKTLAFWMMDSSMYWHMQKNDHDLTIERGIALHKMIRLVTFALGGEAYLNFMGNEFGHPEWIDFPREGNGWSYQHARRQWSLVDNSSLRYENLALFDQAMIGLCRTHPKLLEKKAKELNIDEANHCLMFERSGYVFAFNFHPTFSIPDYRFWIPEPGTYELVLSSDDERFGGHARVDSQVTYQSLNDQGKNELSIYLPNRTALVFKKK